MKLHSFSVLFETDLCEREVIESPFQGKVERLSDSFQRLLKSGRNIHKPFPDFDAVVDWKPSKYAASFNMHTEDFVFGVVSVILPGQNIEEEDKYSAEFQQVINSLDWKSSPPPAMEIIDRPLIYSVLFQLRHWSIGYPEWRKRFSHAVNYMNAIGLAFIRSVSGEEREK